MDSANRAFVKILLSIVVTFCLLSWSVVWWVTGERLPSHDPTETLSPAVADNPKSLSPQAPVPAAFSLHARAASEISPPPPIAAAPLQESEPFKPPIESPPLPPPVKPNAQGVIDLSSEPSTKAFTEFLEQGYARRLEIESGSGAKSSTAPR